MMKVYSKYFWISKLELNFKLKDLVEIKLGFEMDL